MSFNSYLEKLNTKANNARLTLCEYEGVFSVVKLCSSLIVGGRVLLVCTNKTQKKVLELEKVLGKKGFKVSIIEFSGSVYNLDDLSKLFTAPEDVRVAITIENSLAVATSYFASVNNVYSIIVTSDINLKQVFSKKIIVNTKTGIDQVFLTEKRHILIDNGIIDAPQALSIAFADIQSKALALLEYRLRDRAEKTGLNLYSYSEIRSAIIETFSVFAHSKKMQKELLLCALLRIYVADFITGGKVFFGQATNVTSVLIGSENGLDKLKVQKFTLSLLGEMFAKKHENLLECPDYLFRSKYLANNFGVDENFFYNQFLQTAGHLDKLNKGEFEKLEKEVKSLTSSCDRMINIYLALGGSKGAENAQLAKAIKYAGDLPYCVNSLTFLRESGILEYL